MSIPAIPLLPHGRADVHRLSSEFPQFTGRPPRLREGNGYVKGVTVVHTQPLSQDDAICAAGILFNPSTYGDTSRADDCFYPGFGFTFGDELKSVHIQICLDCHWVVFHTQTDSVKVVPTKLGEHALYGLYTKFIGTPIPQPRGIDGTARTQVKNYYID